MPWGGRTGAGKINDDAATAKRKREKKTKQQQHRQLKNQRATEAGTNNTEDARSDKRERRQLD